MAAITIILCLAVLVSLTIYAYQPMQNEILLGSYVTVLPKGKVGPKSEIFKSTKINGPVPTNQWWSSLTWIRYSEAMYPFPLCVKATGEGLSLGYPDIVVKNDAKSIAGSYKNDLIITTSTGVVFPNTTLDGFSDWSVTMLWENPSTTLQTTVIHGSPFVFATFGNTNAKIKFGGTPEFWHENTTSNILGVKVNGHYYAIFSQPGTNWAWVDQTTLTCNKGQPVTIALLPTDNPKEAITYYENYAFNVVTDTRTEWTYDEDQSRVSTKFTVTTDPKRAGTIFGLFPHQWKNLEPQSILPFQYTTIRGTIKTIAAAFFTTSHTYNGILPELPKVYKYSPDELQILNTFIEEVHRERSHYIENRRDTYWAGKAFLRISLLVSIADQIGNSNASNHFLQWLKTALTEYFVAYDDSGNVKYDHLFYYDSNWGTLIGYPASHGSDNDLNDHHFHYGYWVRAAAEIALHDPVWVLKWGYFVNVIIQDFANWNRDSSMYPFLRNFDPYEGHSWASGNAVFWDGNNQESSSEAVNAWSALILWGSATNNKTIRDLGIYLYTTEVSAVEQYWFNADRDIFDPTFKYNYIALVWGGKLDYATWFSPDPQMIRGINMLPITPASLYLGNNPMIVNDNLNQLKEERGSNYWSTWQDILWEYQSFSDAEGAIELYKQQPNYTPEQGESKAHTYSMLNTMKVLGRVQTSVTANTPIYAVFSGPLGNYYVAFNPTRKDITVKFSDGQTMSVKPGKLHTDFKMLL